MEREREGERARERKLDRERERETGGKRDVDETVGQTTREIDTVLFAMNERLQCASLLWPRLGLGAFIMTYKPYW